MAEQVTKDAIKKLDSKLECSICLDTFKQPKLLPCYHVFCKSPCLEKLVARDGHSLTCPTCRHIVPLSEKGVDGLQSDFHIDHLFEIRDAFNTAAQAGQTKCGNGDGGVATGYCHDCEEFLCDNCQAAHKALKLTRSHQIVSIQEFQAQAAKLIAAKKKIPSCEKHQGNELKIYCKTCNELICNDCTIRLHRDHNYDLVADVFLKHKEELVSSLKPVKQKLHTVQQALKAFDTRAKEINDQRATLEAHIHKEIDQLHQLLDQRRAQLVGELDMLTQQKLKSLAAQRDQVEITQVKLTSCLEYAEGGLQTGTESEILAMKAPVIKRIEQISAEFDPDTIQPETRANIKLRIDEKEQVERTCRSYLEVADDQGVSIKKSTVDGKGLTVAEVGTTANLKLCLNTCTGQPCEQEAQVLATITHSQSKRTIRGVVKNEDDGYKISYCPRERGRHELTVTINGRAVRGSPFSVVVMPLPRQLGKPTKVIGGLNRPCGITVNSKQQIIVAERGSDQTTIFNNRFEKIQTFNSQGKGPVGVTVDDADNIYITSLDSHTVTKFTANGDLLLEVGEKGSERLQFNSPNAIAYNKINRKLYVSDEFNHRVQILDTDLTFHRSFGKRGSGKGNFNHPAGIAFDLTGNVYVADWNNHRIQVFTADGAFLRTFGSKGDGPGQLNHPLGVTVSPTGVVFVAEMSGDRISAFKTTGEFIYSFGKWGSKEGEFYGPAGIAIDNDANVMVTNKDNGRIQVF